MARPARRTLVMATAVLAAAIAPVTAARAKNAYVAASSGFVSQYDVGAGGALSPKSPLSLASGNESTAIAVSPDGLSVYVADENSFTLDGATVSQYDVGAGGALTPKSTANVPAGNEAEGVAVSPNGQTVYVANSTNGVLKYDVGAGGALTFPSGSAATGPAEGVAVSPDGGSVYVTTRAASGAVEQFDVGSGGALTPKTQASVAAGDNPQEIALSPDGKSAYVPDIGATTGATNGRVLQYDVGAGGALSPKSHPSVPAGPVNADFNGPEGVAVSPNGRNVYVTNYGEETVHQYSVGAGGALSQKSPVSVGAGHFPEGVAVSTDSKSVYVANDDATTTTVTQFNAGANGALSRKSPDTVTAASNPEAVTVRPDRGPTAAFSASARPAGVATRFDGSASSDPDGTVKRYDWAFGDGKKALNGGPHPKHKYLTAGSKRVTLTVTDDGGCSNTLVFTGQTAACPLNVAGRVSHRVMVIAAKASKLKISPASFKSQGAEVSFKLDVAAPVRFTVQQSRPGRRVGTGTHAHCVKETNANRNKPRCKRTVTLPGHITIKGHAGGNHFHFNGRLGGKTLAPGSYKLVATPTGGRPVSATFHITAG